MVLVNEAFARKYFRGESPLGRTFGIAPGSPRAATAQIVGVVADAKYRTLREAPEPTIYAAWAQEGTASSSARITVRVRGPANAFRPTVLQAIETVQREAVVDFRTLEEDLSASVTQERLVATLSACFGGLALLLAAIGLYGVMSYSVSRRRGEIGIRLALGAAPRRVMRQVLGTVAMILLAGLALGTAASLGAGRLVNALLFNLVATDLTMVGVAAVALALAGGVAGYLPARRAARVDPMVALRES